MNAIVKPKFMLVGLVNRGQTKDDILADFTELQSLVDTYGGVVFAAATQNISKRDGGTYIGSGKAEEITDTILKEGIDVVVINDILKSSQIYNLKEIFDVSNPSIRVWDRIDLILNIFKKHATTTEAKLQIRLAEIKHQGPTLQGMGLTMSQQGGGIGTRGKGETSTEEIKRHYKNEIRDIQKELQQVTKNRQQQIDYRKKSRLPTISIVGYTNAGKSTLFHTLTNKKTYIADALFATLDSSVSKIYFKENNKECYISDTIGFIKDLPPDLINAFKSTLLETVNADLILHVIDISDPLMIDKIQAVEDILKSLHVENIPQIYVFNKIDQVEKIPTNIKTTYQKYQPQFISASQNLGIEELISAISTLVF